MLGLRMVGRGQETYPPLPPPVTFTPDSRPFSRCSRSSENKPILIVARGGGNTGHKQSPLATQHCSRTAEPGGGGGGHSPPLFAKTTFRFQNFLGKDSLRLPPPPYKLAPRALVSLPPVENWLRSPCCCATS